MADKWTNDAFVPVDESGLNSWADVVRRFEGRQVGLHRHAQLSERHGQHIFSVLAKPQPGGGEVSVAHVAEAHVRSPLVKVDRHQLSEHLNRDPVKKTGKPVKTRNTMIVGEPVESPPSGQEVDVITRPGHVRMGENVLIQMRTEPGEVKVRGQVKQGMAVPQQPVRSRVFAEAATFGRFGVRAVNPLGE